ncbi:MAG: methyltransferase domain-containing protein [Candidatus Binatia bacterium]
MSVREVFDRTAKDYDRARRQLAPCFDDFYDTVLKRLPYRHDDTFSVLDLGAGTGLSSLFIAQTFPRAQLTLMDVSPAMLSLARERFAVDDTRFQFLVGDFVLMPFPETYDVIVSALAIHHVPGEEKLRLFRKVYECLPSGGVFINADQVIGPTPEMEHQYRQAWLTQVRALGVSDADLERGLTRMQEDQPSPLEVQVRWLTEAGFSNVRCDLDRQMFVVFSGVK